jgi:hypothetical protein
MVLDNGIDDLVEKVPRNIETRDDAIRDEGLEWIVVGSLMSAIFRRAGHAQLAEATEVGKRGICTMKASPCLTISLMSSYITAATFCAMVNRWSSEISKPFNSEEEVIIRFIFSTISSFMPLASLTV